VCRRRLPTCEPCAGDAACGDDDTFINPGRCVEHEVFRLDIIVSEPVCLRLPGPYGGCPPNQTVGGSGFCEPPGHACNGGGYCERDDDCSRHAPCDPLTSRCIYSDCLASWPWSEETSHCPDKSTCVPFPEALDPELLDSCSTAFFYGSHGLCSVTCAVDEDCAYVVDPWNRPYVCRPGEEGNGCRPAGCLDDAECPPPSGTSGAYCDPATMACVQGACRLGLDPRPGCGQEVPWDDCAPGFACVAAASGDAVGTCVAVAP
jgi:hypothetical protein